MTVKMSFVVLTMSLFVFVGAALAQDYKGFYANYCTAYAARKFDEGAPTPKTNWRGNAQEWLSNAGRAGWKTTTNPREAKRGAVVVWSGGGYGHVAFVESVSSDGVNISEMNYGPLSPPGNKDGKTTNFGKVTSTTLKFNRMGRGSLTFSGYVLPERK